MNESLGQVKEQKYFEGEGRVERNACQHGRSSYCIVSYCVVPQIIHTHPMEGHWKFLGEGGLKSSI